LLSTWARRSSAATPTCTSSCCSWTSAEEVTHFRRVVPASPRLDVGLLVRLPHRLSRLAIERPSGCGGWRHVVILLDSFTRLGRASNREMGRRAHDVGGVDNRASSSAAFFGAARNCEARQPHILATAHRTGSRMTR